MDELSPEELQELEEKLYSQVHHDLNSEVTFSENNDNDAKTEEQDKPTSRFLSKRYWVDKCDKNKTKNIEQKITAVMEKPKDVAIPTATIKSKKVRNPFATAVPKQRLNQKGPKNSDKNGPFAMKNKKLQSVVRWNEKKQKSKNARTVNQKPVETVVLDLSDDCTDSDAEVIHVPLPPNPVYTVDDSDEDAEKSPDNSKNPTAPTKALVSPKESRVVTKEIPSRCNSPNSVMSHDDFIGQGDCHRLTEKAVIADNEDLLDLTNNADSLMEPPSPPKIADLLQSKNIANKNRESSDEIECLGTFIKPATMMASNDKNRYRVDQGSDFRAMDVYESESDIVSDGVYSKATSKSVPLTPVIKNIDNSSEEEVEDISISQAKMKRLRKRRASGSIKGSESNGADDSSDDAGNDGVAETAVPFISRGPAVENYKSKKFRKRAISASGRMSDTEFMATLNSLAQGSNNSTGENEGVSEEEEEVRQPNVPSARDIAEKVLQKEQEVEIYEEPSTSSGRSKKTSNEEISDQIVDNVEEILNKINKMSEKKTAKTIEEDFCNISTEMHSEPEGNSRPAVIDLDDQSEENEGEADVGNDSSTNAPTEKIKYFIGYIQPNICNANGLGWNEEMCRFYNFSWGEEHTKEEDILRRMNRDRRVWRIIDADRYPAIRRDRREKCINCLSFGHVRARCPKPRRPQICYMCGESGHLESRCPNTRCLRCGSKTMIYSQSCKKCMYWNNRICPICKLRGHSLNDCPDKWRRYHSTTQPNLHPNSNLIYNKKRYCCFCGWRGHLSDECRKAVHRSEYPIISNEIKSHEKSYDDVIVNPYKLHDIPCRLLADPQENFELELAEKTTPTKVYGRFLCAVGLADSIGKKQRQNRHPSATTSTTSNARNRNSKTSAGADSTNKNTESPEQVPEVSGSQTESNEDLTMTTDEERLQMPPPPVPDAQEPIVDLDSDSNYSFSDHFEPNTSPQNSGPFPDFIPLGGSSANAPELEPHTNLSVPKVGISSKFVESYSDEDDAHIPHDSPKSPIIVDQPCEAKIYISDQHSKYFQSKLGQEYLAHVTSANNLTGRLNKTIVGYALFIHGLPVDQEKLRSELETKYKLLNNEKSQQYEISSKVPKHVDVLIRFLRDSINQLYTNLGNAAELYKRLIELDKQHSKSSAKSADRIRRTLNMIFLGQAGLNNGDKYFDAILEGLTVLVNNHNNTEKTPEELRNRIDLNWRKLFTSYNHKNYSQLLLAYLKLSSTLKNRLPALKIEPSLLGLSKMDVSLNSEQITRLNEGIGKQYDVSSSNTENNLVLNVTSARKSQQHTNDNTAKSNAPKRQQLTQNKMTTAAPAPSNKSNNSNNLNRQALFNRTEQCNDVPAINKESTLLLNIFAVQKNQQQIDVMKKNTLANATTSSKRPQLPMTNNNKASNQSRNPANEAKQIFIKSEEKTHKPTTTTTTATPANSTSANNSQNHNYDHLLSEICSPPEARNLTKGEDSRSPSSFWSRESQQFVTFLLNHSKKPATIERLQRINEKALNGGLSYNDYRAVIKLYTAIATIKE